MHLFVYKTNFLVVSVLNNNNKSLTKADPQLGCKLSTGCSKSGNVE